jgi:hypothetical protein
MTIRSRPTPKANPLSWGEIIVCDLQITAASPYPDGLEDACGLGWQTDELNCP